MVNEREIFGGEELMKFFCKDAIKNNIDCKEFCRFIVEYEFKRIYTGIYTSYEDGDALYNDLLNPNIKWNVTWDYSFEADGEVLQFENGEQYVEFNSENYDDVKDFFEANEIKK